MIRVVVCDDHAVIRLGLVELLDGVGDIEVVATAANGEEAVARAAELQPDVVLIDLAMPVLDGTAAARMIRAANPNVKVLVLTTFDDPRMIDGALTAGASGYLLKDEEPSALIGAIRAAVGGGVPLSPAVAAHIIRRPVETPDGILTMREAQILALTIEGLSNKQIARRLGISDTTVKTHFSNIFDRIGVRDRTQAALWYSRQVEGGNPPDGLVARAPD